MTSKFLKIRTYIFTSRRNFWPLMALLYLTYPGSELIHLGWFVSISAITTFLIEIPTGYISDRIGYKKTLIISKIAMFLSTACLIVGEGFRLFALANVFFSVARAFSSGTLQAFIHEKLEAEGKGDVYGKFMSNMSGEISLLSVAFIIGFPVLYKIDPLLPFYIAGLIDLLGLGIAFSLRNPPTEKYLGSEKKVYRSMLNLLGEFIKNKKFLLVSIVVGIAWSLYLSQANFREPYLVEIGYPVALIGFVMGASRLFHYIFGRAIRAFKQVVELGPLLLVDGLVLGALFAATVVLPASWVWIGIVFSVMSGYFLARRPLYTQHLIGLMPDKNYKATFLSIKSQLGGLLTFVMPVVVGYMMSISYVHGFLFVAATFVATGLVSWGVLQYLYARKSHSSSDENR